MTLTETDGVAGHDPVTADTGTSSIAGSRRASPLVQTDAPVSSIDIEYGNLGPAFQRVRFTAIFYGAILLDSGAGNDTVFGDQGEGDITGGTGNAGCRARALRANMSSPAVMKRPSWRHHLCIL